MKPKIRVPYFEIGFKNYVYGDTLLEYAIAADKAAEKYDIDVLIIAPVVEIRRIAEHTKHLIILAPHMDPFYPGRGIANILPEGLKAAGAHGVVVNHCENPISIPSMRMIMDRAEELDFLVFACADSIAEAKALAQLHPDILNPEPSELIGIANDDVCNADYIKNTVESIKSIYSDILVEQAAGIRTGQQVYECIMAGSDAAGASSGIMTASDPIAMINEMVAATRKAADELMKLRQ